jgi:hypothetical protein
MHGGKNSGAPKGNRNARKHGFSTTAETRGAVASLRSTGFSPDEIGSDAMRPLVEAKAAQSAARRAIREQAKA